jgi:hypothetical protein
MATTESNYIITPVIGLIPYPYNFKTDDWETNEVIEVPISVLLNKDNCETGTAFVEGKNIESYSYKYGKRVIWGATARILKQLLDLIC